MMEYQAVISMGAKSSMKISFADGSMTAIGVNPATYSTDNFMIQHAIENSAQYKRGLIKLVNSIELDADVVIDSQAKATATAPAAAQAEAEGDAGETEATTQTEEQTESTDEAEAKTEGEAESQALEKVEFSCNEDAKDYLEEKFQVTRSKLKNRADIIAAGAAYGIEVVFI